MTEDPGIIYATLPLHISEPNAGGHDEKVIAVTIGLLFSLTASALRAN